MLQPECAAWEQCRLFFSVSQNVHEVAQPRHNTSTPSGPDGDGSYPNLHLTLAPVGHFAAQTRQPRRLATASVTDQSHLTGDDCLTGVNGFSAILHWGFVLYKFDGLNTWPYESCRQSY